MKKREEEMFGGKKGLHKMAVCADGVDLRKKRAVAKNYSLAKLARQEELLAENAILADKFSIVDEFGFEKFDVAERQVQLFDNALAVQSRLDAKGDSKQKRFDAKRAKERRAYKRAQFADEERYDTWVENTWELGEEEYISLADKEDVDKVRGMIKDIVQIFHDNEYRDWYEQSKLAEAKETEQNQKATSFAKV